MMSFPPKLLVLRNVIGHLQVLEILEISCNFIDVSGKFLYVMPNFDLRVCISNTVHHLLQRVSIALAMQSAVLAMIDSV